MMTGAAQTLTAERPPAGADQRGQARHEGEGLSAALFVRGAAHGARVLNISVAGAMLETAARPCLDDHVVIAFEGCTPVHASVRWVKGGRVGVHFGKVLVLA